MGEKLRSQSTELNGQYSEKGVSFYIVVQPRKAASSAATPTPRRPRGGGHVMRHVKERRA